MTVTKTLSDKSKRRIDDVNNAINAGFASEAGKKVALQNLRWVYDEIRDAVMRAILNERGEVVTKIDTVKDAVGFVHTGMTVPDYTPAQEALNDLYYKFPDFQHVKPATFQTYARYPLMDVLKDIVELRQIIKDIPLAPKAPRRIEVVAKAIMRSIQDEMEGRQANYERGVKMTEFFGNMHVYRNSHLVTNYSGTTFVRNFFYLEGKLTALDTIIAVAEKTEEFREKFEAGLIANGMGKFVEPRSPAKK